MPAARSAPDFRALLRQWRHQRHLSQLDLATLAGVSARHLSFLETGRSAPGRSVVAALAGALDLPLADRNLFLAAAGFAPVYAQRRLDAPELAPARRALEFMLAQQEPFPALVLDEAWDIRMRNQAAERLFAPLRSQYGVPADLRSNALHVLCHPQGLRQFMRNWEEFIAAFLQILLRDATHGLDQAAARLHGELLRYPGIAQAARAAEDGRPGLPFATMQLRLDDADLDFFVLLTTFAMPRDVTLQQIRVESFFPADIATERWVRARATDSTPALTST